MKIDESVFENLIRDSEKLRHVVSIATDGNDPYVDRNEILRACGLPTVKEHDYVD